MLPLRLDYLLVLLLQFGFELFVLERTDLTWLKQFTHGWTLTRACVQDTAMQNQKGLCDNSVVGGVRGAFHGVEIEEAHINKKNNERDRSG